MRAELMKLHFPKSSTQGPEPVLLHCSVSTVFQTVSWRYRPFDGNPRIWTICPYPFNNYVICISLQAVSTCDKLSRLHSASTSSFFNTKSFASSMIHPALSLVITSTPYCSITLFSWALSRNSEYFCSSCFARLM